MPSPPSKGPHLVRLLQPHLARIRLSVAAGLCAGAATVALLATVKGALHRYGGMTDEGLTLYVALCVAALVGRESDFLAMKKEAKTGKRSRLSPRIGD